MGNPTRAAVRRAPNAAARSTGEDRARRRHRETCDPPGVRARVYLFAIGAGPNAAQALEKLCGVTAPRGRPPNSVRPGGSAPRRGIATRRSVATSLRRRNTGARATTCVARDVGSTDANDWAPANPEAVATPTSNVVVTKGTATQLRISIPPHRQGSPGESPQTRRHTGKQNMGTSKGNGPIPGAGQDLSPKYASERQHPRSMLASCVRFVEQGVKLSKYARSSPVRPQGREAKVHMHTRVLLTATAAGILMLGLASRVSAATSGITTATITVQGGSLSITVPADAGNLGTRSTRSAGNGNRLARSGSGE